MQAQDKGQQQATRRQQPLRIGPPRAAVHVQHAAAETRRLQAQDRGGREPRAVGVLPRPRKAPADAQGDGGARARMDGRGAEKEVVGGSACLVVEVL